MSPALQSPRPTPKGPIRTCAGCRSRDAQDELCRLRAFELGSDGATGAASARGVYVHPRQRCIEGFVAGGASRSLRARVGVDAALVEVALREQLRKKLLSLLSAARSKRACAVGESAVREALQSGNAEFLLFASDAAGRRNSFERTAMEAEIPVYSWGTKQELGQCWQRAALGVLAVSDKRIAKEVARVMRGLAELAEGA